MNHETNPNQTLQFINLWITLMLIWLLVNGSLANDVLLTGAVVTGFISLVFAKFSQAYNVVRWSPSIVYNYFLYFIVFMDELIKANLNVMKIVLSPKIDIKPGIVEIKTNLKSSLGRMALANSITLTPGTLVVDIRDDSLFIHWINVTATDPVAATQEIAGRFEKYLKVIYG